MATRRKHGMRTPPERAATAGRSSDGLEYQETSGLPTDSVSLCIFPPVRTRRRTTPCRTATSAAWALQLDMRSTAFDFGTDCSAKGELD